LEFGSYLGAGFLIWGWMNVFRLFSGITSKELFESWSGVLVVLYLREHWGKDCCLHAKISRMQCPLIFRDCWKTNEVSFHEMGKDKAWSHSLWNLELWWQHTSVINLGLRELLCNAEKRLADLNSKERKTPWDFRWMCGTESCAVSPGVLPPKQFCSVFSVTKLTLVQRCLFFPNLVLL